MQNVNLIGLMISWHFAIHFHTFFSKLFLIVPMEASLGNNGQPSISCISHIQLSEEMISNIPMLCFKHFSTQELIFSYQQRSSCGFVDNNDIAQGILRSFKICFCVSFNEDLLWDAPYHCSIPCFFLFNVWLINHLC